MSDIAIKVEGLSKRYKIGKLQRRHDTLRDRIADARVFNLFKRRNGSSLTSDLSSSDILWALKDVSFEVKRGEVVGIIGRNGAGKSTLLKILSRITEPTEGYADINGRVASLLEVGTGFHPELTGRENIYLNGSILGMKRAEINGKFDEIVAFAEIERFIDTPVKHYSSGMYVRLAFAVAAHLEPEILLVDEVLAVGDAAFQKKCLGKMGDVARQGRTVLFVSHNMAAINQLCSRGVLLESGRVKAIGQAQNVVRDYFVMGTERHETIDLRNYAFRQGIGEVKFEWAQLRDSHKECCRRFSIGDDITVAFQMISSKVYLGTKVKVAVELRASDGLLLSNMVDVDSGFQIEHLRSVEVLSVSMKDIRLYPDTYYISLWVGSITSIDTLDRVEDCLSFEITDGGRLTSRSLPRSGGLLFLTPEWNDEDVDVFQPEISPSPIPPLGSWHAQE